MSTGLRDALITWLGIVLLIGAGAAVLLVDVARELTADTGRHPRWIAVVAYVIGPILIFAAGVATVVRIFTLA